MVLVADCDTSLPPTCLLDRIFGDSLYAFVEVAPALPLRLLLLRISLFSKDTLPFDLTPCLLTTSETVDRFSL
jgi:hypothetical protein